MRCERCQEKAVSLQPPLCKQHFDEFILETVKRTIERWNLIENEERIVVAVSGGKDSLTTLDVLSRLGYQVHGLFINEGIRGYRRHSQEDLNKFCEDNGLSYTEVSFQEEFGFTLDEAVLTKKFHPCTTCGTLRRYLLNKHANKYDIIATGHNLDDESQTIMINLFRANIDLFPRLGPKTSPSKWFVKKIKPLYLLTEKQVLTYTLLRGIKTQFSECPYATVSYRAALRESLNKYESEHPGTKRNIIEGYVKLKEHLPNKENKDEQIKVCENCGQASNERICKACRITSEVSSAVDDM
ncbi:MAG: TIGR00269 family protein [Candidatus Woesearchaeota archaeon]